MIYKSLSLILFGTIILGSFSGCDKEKPAQPKGDRSAWTFRKISGDNQTVRVYDTLANRMVVELMDGLGEPVVNEQLRYEVMSGSGAVTAKPVVAASPAEVMIPTDFLGRAAVSLRCYDTSVITVQVAVVSRPELDVQFSETGIQP